jgi:hypothetical protein
LHDGESEPDAASAETRLRVESLEWQEEARELAGRNEGPRVRDREQRAFCGRVGCELDAAAGDVVADGVGKEVRDEALDELRVAVCQGPFERRFHGEPLEIVVSHELRGDRAEVDYLAPAEPALTPGEDEARFEQAFLLHACVQDVLSDISPGGYICIGIGECELEECALGRQRRAELVSDDGGEACIRVMRSGCGLHGHLEPRALVVMPARRRAVVRWWGDHDRFGDVRRRLWCHTTAGSANHPPGLLEVTPAGIGFSQVVGALLSWEEIVPVFDELLNVTLLFWDGGSGRSGKPCERIQTTASRWSA